jgi:phytoene synthase
VSDLDDAYARCDEITRSEAKNFSYGIRLLPEQKRHAMSALYAFARRVDDIGDGRLPVQEKRSALLQVREEIARAANGEATPADPVMFALADAMHRYPITAEELAEVVTGCELDGTQNRWESYADLEYYCTCVAGSIGRLSLAVFGTDEPQLGSHLANRLGIGLQITNILRDVVEDRETMGRVYLPQEDLRGFGCNEDATGPTDALVELVHFEAARAITAYNEGLALLDLLDHRSRACVAAMSGIYRRLLTRIERAPEAIFATRVSLPTYEKAWVAIRALAGAGV